MNERCRCLLEGLSQIGLVVGSASWSDDYHDIDILVPERRWNKVAALFKDLEVTSAFPWNLKTFETTPPVEVFVVWYGPLYEEARKLPQVRHRSILGIDFKVCDFGYRKGATHDVV